jgi:hypothetical protein
MVAHLEARRIAVFPASGSAWPRSAVLADSVHKIVRIDLFIIHIDRDTEAILTEEIFSRPVLQFERVPCLPQSEYAELKVLNAAHRGPVVVTACFDEREAIAQRGG